MNSKNKKEDFQRLAENRTNKVLDMLDLIGNLSNPYFYEYTDEEIKRIFDAIQESLLRNKEKFSHKKKGKKRKFTI